MLPDLALGLTLISSNYPCLEHIFMVPKVFEPLKFYCTFIYLANSSGTFVYNNNRTVIHNHFLQTKNMINRTQTCYNIFNRYRVELVNEPNQRVLQTGSE